jgi:hypothetical protein
MTQIQSYEVLFFLEGWLDPNSIEPRWKPKQYKLLLLHSYIQVEPMIQFNQQSITYSDSDHSISDSITPYFVFLLNT